jgi:hypothetical protein
MEVFQVANATARGPLHTYESDEEQNEQEDLQAAFDEALRDYDDTHVTAFCYCFRKSTYRRCSKSSIKTSSRCLKCTLMIDLCYDNESL